MPYYLQVRQAGKASFKKGKMEFGNPAKLVSCTINQPPINSVTITQLCQVRMYADRSTMQHA